LKVRILAVSHNVLLKFGIEDEAAGNKLKLEKALMLKDVKEVVSSL
jgi:hypothetical protein